MGITLIYLCCIDHEGITIDFFYTNIIFYDNQNKTLPIGMDKDTRIIAKLANTDITLDSKKTIRIGKLEEEDELSSKLIVKTINILEYTVKQIERNENGRI